MAQGRSKTTLITTIIALALTLLIVGGIVLAANLNQPAADDSSIEESKAEDLPVEADPEEQTPTVDEPEASVVDPSTLRSIDVEPMGLTVYYTKGTPGFEFSVKRTEGSTEYVEFSSPELVGTKCTDDEGSFASIIKNPSSPEDKSTINETTQVGEDTYGLSLAAENCTSDVDLLKEYQSAFSNGFSMLEEMEEE